MNANVEHQQPLIQPANFQSSVLPLTTIATPQQTAITDVTVQQQQLQQQSLLHYQQAQSLGQVVGLVVQPSRYDDTAGQITNISGSSQGGQLHQPTQSLGFISQQLPMTYQSQLLQQQQQMEIDIYKGLEVAVELQAEHQSQLTALGSVLQTQAPNSRLPVTSWSPAGQASSRGQQLISQLATAATEGGLTSSPAPRSDAPINADLVQQYFHMQLQVQQQQQMWLRQQEEIERKYTQQQQRLEQQVRQLQQQLDDQQQQQVAQQRRKQFQQQKYLSQSASFQQQQPPTDTFHRTFDSSDPEVEIFVDESAASNAENWSNFCDPPLPGVGSSLIGELGTTKNYDQTVPVYPSLKSQHSWFDQDSNYLDSFRESADCAVVTSEDFVFDASRNFQLMNGLDSKLGLVLPPFQFPLDYEALARLSSGSQTTVTSNAAFKESKVLLTDSKTTASTLYTVTCLLAPFDYCSHWGVIHVHKLRFIY
jgi:hypothetical protein